MASLTLQVNNSADDASQSASGTVSTNAATVTLTSHNAWLGLRFTNVTIPKDSIINSATLELYCHNVNNGDPDFAISAQAADNPATFAAVNNDISSRPKTTPPVTWTATLVGTGFVAKSGLQSIVQGIVNRSGWVSGNALVLLLDAGANVNFSLRMYDNAAVDAAKLTIDYTPPSSDPIDLVRGGSVVSSYNEIQLAVNNALSGDVIQIGAGTYYEHIDIHGKSKITLEPKPGLSREDVVISGAIEELFTSPSGKWTHHGTVFTHEVYRYSYSSNQNNMQAIKANGTRLWTYGDYSHFVSDNTIPITRQHAGEGIFFDEAASRIYVILTGNANPNNVSMKISGGDYVIDIRNSSDITIKGLTLELGGTAIVFIRNQSHRNYIRDCTLRYMGNGGVFLQQWASTDTCNDNVIEDCTIFDVYDSDWLWEDVKNYNPKKMESSGVKLSGAGSRNIVRRCEVYGTFNGINLNTPDAGPPYNDGALIYKNVVHDIRDDALEPENYVQNAEFFLNEVYDAYVGFAFTPLATGPIYFYRNRITANKNGPGGALGRCTKRSENQQVHHIYMYHNVFYAEGTTLPIANDDANIQGKLDNIGVYNNIVLISQDKLAISGSPLHTKSSVYNGNIYYRASGTTNLFRNFNSVDDPNDQIDPKVYPTLADFKASQEGQASNWEANGKQGNPNISMSTYEILPGGSIAIGAGVALPSGLPDRTSYDGNLDVGWLPYGATLPEEATVYKNDANLKGLWLLNDSLNDASPNGNNLTENNDITFNSIHKKEGTHSADFERTDSRYASITDAAQTGLDITGNLSIVLWIRPETVGIIQRLVAKYNLTGNQRSYQVVLNASNAVDVFISADGTNAVNAFTVNGVVATAGIWYHLAVVYNGTDIRIYVNGVLSSNGVNNPKAHTGGIFNSTASFMLGNREGSTDYFDGLMDEVAVFNRALSSDEVDSLYANGIRNP